MLKVNFRFEELWRGSRWRHNKGSLFIIFPILISLHRLYCTTSTQAWRFRESSNWQSDLTSCFNSYWPGVQTKVWKWTESLRHAPHSSLHIPLPCCRLSAVEAVVCFQSQGGTEPTCTDLWLSVSCSSPGIPSYTPSQRRTADTGTCYVVLFHCFWSSRV